MKVASTATDALALDCFSLDFFMSGKVPHILSVNHLPLSTVPYNFSMYNVQKSLSGESKSCSMAAKGT